MVFEGQIGSGRHQRLTDSDSDAENDSDGIVLTAARASDLCPVPHRLLAKNNQIRALEDLTRLSSLDYIDLSCNKLRSLEGLNQPRLKTLNVSNNELTDFSAIYKCESLHILNISKNNLGSLDWLRHCKFSGHLKVLVATHNSLTSVDALRCLRDVETLVLSHNEIADLSPIAGLQNVVKVSATENYIRDFNWVKNMFNLKELRLTKNRIDQIPVARLAKLKIADFGQNLLRTVQELASVMPYVTSLNIAGNKFENEEDAKKTIKETCTEVEILDGIRLKGGSRKVRVNRIRKRAGLEVEADRNYARLPTDEQLERIEDKDSGVANDVKRFMEQKKRTMKEREKEKQEEKQEKLTVENVEKLEDSKRQDRNTEADATKQRQRIKRRKRNNCQKEQERESKKRKVLDNGGSPEKERALSNSSGGNEEAKKEEKNRENDEAADKKENISPTKKSRRKERKGDSDSTNAAKNAPPLDRKGQRSHTRGIEAAEDDDGAMDASEFVRIARRANVEVSTPHKQHTSSAKKKNCGRKQKRDLIRKKVKPVRFGDGGRSQW